VAQTLALAKSTVCYHARRLGYEAAGKYARRYDWDEIRLYYEQGHSVNECCERFGFTRSAWCDAARRGDVVPRPRAAALDVYLVTDRMVHRGHLKRRLLAERIKAYRCERCGIDDWRGRPLTLEVHHVSGDRNDNRLQNLRILCPNCHSQTENYGGRNLGRRAAAHRIKLLERE
jgi:5-methylcytosine-specific restriction endonuclease McrA